TPTARQCSSGSVSGHSSLDVLQVYVDVTDDQPVEDLLDGNGIGTTNQREVHPAVQVLVAHGGDAIPDVFAILANDFQCILFRAVAMLQGVLCIPGIDELHRHWWYGLPGAGQFCRLKRVAERRADVMGNDADRALVVLADE